MALTQEEINEYMARRQCECKEQIDIEKQKRLCKEMGTKAYIEMIVGQGKQMGGLQ